MMRVRAWSVVAIAAVSGACLSAIGGAPASATPTTTVTRLVGGGVGDGLLAPQAALSPMGTTVASDGATLVADLSHLRIRRIDPTTGVISTIAGRGRNAAGQIASSADGTAATSAYIGMPVSVAERSGTVYFADVNLPDGGPRVRRIDPVTGALSTIAGGGTNPPTDGAVATSVTFTYYNSGYSIQRISVDSTGRVLIATGCSVWRVLADGHLSLVAGQGGVCDYYAAPGKDGDTAVGGAFGQVVDVVGESSGSFVVASTDAIRRVSAGGLITVLAGATWDASDGTARTSSVSVHPQSLDVDATARVWFDDAFSSGKVHTFVVGGPITTPTLPCDQHVGLDAAGQPLLLCGALLTSLRKNVSGTWVPFAGIESQGIPNGTTGTASNLTGVGPIVRDGNDILFGTGRTVERLTPDGIVHRVAGSGLLQASDPLGGDATTTTLDNVASIAVVGGHVWFSDGRVVMRVAGDGTVQAVTATGSGATYTPGMNASAFKPDFTSGPPIASDGTHAFIIGGTSLYRIDPDLTVTRVADDVRAGVSDGSISVSDMDVDSTGRVLVAVHWIGGPDLLRRLEPDGTMKTLATGVPNAISVDGADNVWLAGTTVDVLAPDGSRTHWIGQAGSSTETGTPLTSFKMGTPSDIAVVGSHLVIGAPEAGLIVQTSDLDYAPLAAPTNVVLSRNAGLNAITATWDTAGLGAFDKVRLQLTELDEPFAPTGAPGPTIAVDASAGTATVNVETGRAYTASLYRSLDGGWSVPVSQKFDGWHLPNPIVAPILLSSNLLSGKYTKLTATFDVGYPGGGVANFACWVDGQYYVPCTDGHANFPNLPEGSYTFNATSFPGHSTATLSVPFIVDRSAPVPSTTAFPAPFILSTSARVAWSATDARSGVTAYGLRYNLQGASTTQPTSWTYPSSLAATTARSATVAVPRGATLCASVRAEDKLAIWSGYSAARCVAVPLDDLAMKRSTGWSVKRVSSYYAGTYSETKTAGRTLSTPVASARRIGIVATTCKSCGMVAVYVGARYIGTINLYSTATSSHVIKTLPAFAATSGTLKLVTKSKDRLVRIEGVGVVH